MPKQSKQYTIGIDIGGTKMRAILFNGKKIIEEDTLGTPQESIMHFMVMLSALIDPMIERAKREKVEIKGIGVGVSGIINHEKKRIIKTPNIDILNGENLEEKMEEKFKLNVEMDNDANCFLRAEMLNGAGKKYKNAFGLIVGTGIGGAWWFNDNLYKGSHFAEGEPGVMITSFENPVTLEDVYQKLNHNDPAKLANEAYHGESLSIEAYKEIGNYLGIAMANIVNIIDPEVIIIGGGVAGSEDLFFPQMKKSIKKYIMSTDVKNKIKIIKGKLEKDAGAIGAALLIEQET